MRGGSRKSFNSQLKHLAQGGDAYVLDEMT